MFNCETTLFHLVSSELVHVFHQFHSFLGRLIVAEVRVVSKELVGELMDEAIIERSELSLVGLPDLLTELHPLLQGRAD